MAKPEPKPKQEVCPTSSSPAGLPKKQHELFRDVLALFEGAGLPYAVAGAFALREHTGVCRFTKDLDLFLGPEAASEALAILREKGFTCEIRDPVWLAKAHRDGFFVDLITGMSNGVMSVDPSWIARARRTHVLGVQTRVLAPEELLASKLFVIRRERFDGADIAHIIYATGGQLDWNRILELTGAHWEMLLWTLVLFRYVYPAQAHFVPLVIWTQLVNRLLFRLLNPDPAARFRGSLVDENMFAIDVKEWGLDDLLSEYRALRAKKIEWPPDNVEASEASKGAA